MELEIRFMHGPRSGQSIRLDSDINSADQLPYVLESEPVSFLIGTEERLNRCVLLFQGVEYQFVEADVVLGGYLYALKPKRGFRGFEAIFQNYFGLVNLHVMYETEDGVEKNYHFPPVEVLARKLNANQAVKMIDYILNEEGDLYSCLSPTSMGTDLAYGGEQPKQVIQKLEKILSALDEIIPTILVAPLKRLSAQLMNISGREADEIDEQGIAWLMENLSVLDLAIDQDVYHLEYDGERYFATEIQTSRLRENTDIYENRIIHGFLVSLQRFVVDFEKEARKTKNVSGNTYEGYISFFSALGGRIEKNQLFGGDRIGAINVKIKKYLDLLNRFIPVSSLEEGLPVVTAKVRPNKAYSSLYRTIAQWYKNNKVDWRNRDFLLAIQSIPKLFEYYTVLRAKNALANICQNVSSINKNSIFTGKYDNAMVDLFYEPTYWSVGHKNYSGGPFRTEIGSYKRAMRNTPFRFSNHINSKRVPDIVIHLTSVDSEVFIILDAKYSNMKKSYEDYLPDLTYKYVHGIGTGPGKSSVMAMIILCPSELAVYADMHAPPYGLFESETVFPILGVQGIDFDSNVNNELNFESSLTRLLECCNDFEPKFKLVDSIDSVQSYTY